MDEVISIATKKKKMLPPDGCTSFSIGGKTFSMPKRESKVPYIEAEEPVANEMLSHGFVEWKGSIEASIAK